METRLETRLEIRLETRLETRLPLREGTPLPPAGARVSKRVFTRVSKRVPKRVSERGSKPVRDGIFLYCSGGKICSKRFYNGPGQSCGADDKPNMTCAPLTAAQFSDLATK